MTRLGTAITEHILHHYGPSELLSRLNDPSGLARRYHWHSTTVRDFTSEPHTGIVGENKGVITNLVDSRAKHAQQALLTIAREHPDKTLSEARKLVLPRHHDVRAGDV